MKQTPRLAYPTPAGVADSSRQELHAVNDSQFLDLLVQSTIDGATIFSLRAAALLRPYVLASCTRRDSRGELVEDG